MRKSLTPPSGARRRKTTVGSIVVPELPWQRLRDIDREAADRARREADCGCACPTCGHESGSLDYCDQVDCDCVDPFHCT